MSAKENRVVAELGRPETPEETANRKQTDRLRRRQAQTPFNLILALLACLLVVGAFLLFTEQPGPNIPTADFKSIASKANASVPLAAPEIPNSWHSNSAQFDPSPADKVATWSVGFVTAGNEFIGLKQGIDANPSWVANQLGARQSTGTTSIDGISWTIYDYRHLAEAKNLAYAMETDGKSSSFVLYGTAKVSEFQQLAELLSQWIKTNG